MCLADQLAVPKSQPVFQGQGTLLKLKVASGNEVRRVSGIGLFTSKWMRLPGDSSNLLSFGLPISRTTSSNSWLHDTVDFGALS